MGVGGFPGLANPFRRTQRAMVNPLDKSTIISIFPRELDEFNPTIQPGRFIVPPGTFDKPSTLVVGPSSWFREIDEDQPLLEIPNSSIQIAEAVIRDYCTGLLGCDMNSRRPGLFFIPGEHKIKDLQKSHEHLFIAARVKQDAWYASLIDMADVLWARTSGNPLSVSGDMRLAASELSLEKDWMKNQINTAKTRCVACGSLRNPTFPVCPNCKAVVDVEKAKELGLTFAN